MNLFNLNLLLLLASSLSLSSASAVVSPLSELDVLLSGPELGAPRDGARALTTHACEQAWCVRAVLRNPASAAAPRTRRRVLRAPLEPVEGARAFEVREAESGRVLEYVGALAKRRAPVYPDDYEELEAGEALAAVVDLSTGYRFRAGVRYAAAMGGAEVEFVPAEDSPEPWHREAAARAAAPLETRRTPAGVLYTTTGSCTSAYSLDTAVTTARTLSTEAHEQFFERNCTGTSYTEWFGTITGARYATVTRGYRLIQDRLDTSDFRISCGGSSCSASTFAYVFPADTSTHTIYLCGAYVSAPLSLGPYDTKFGTLIHELSHFRDIADTEDHAYGQSALRSLAISDPGRAVDNADSYEYFVEDDPTICATPGTVPADGSSSDACSPFSGSCSACTAQGSCGWCEDTQSCYESSSSGPDDFTCSAGAFAWLSSTCSSVVSDGSGDDSCTRYDSCDSCTQRGQCGWCESSDRCYESSSTGPNLASCSDFDWLPSECESETSAVVAIVVAVGVATAVGACIFCCVRSRRQKQQAALAASQRPMQPALGSMAPVAGGGYPPQQQQQQPYGAQPYASQPYASQPYASQPYASQPYGAPPQAYAAQQQPQYAPQQQQQPAYAPQQQQPAYAPQAYSPAPQPSYAAAAPEGAPPPYAPTAEGSEGTH